MDEDQKPRKIVYTAEPTPAKFHASNAFFRGLRGPVGSSKTSACIMELYTRALEQKPFENVRRSRWVLVRNTYPELLSTTLKTFQDWIPAELCPITRSPSLIGKMELNLDDRTSVEAEFLFLALDTEDDANKLKSLEVTGAFINEASEIRESVLKLLTSRVGRAPSPAQGGASWSGIIADTNSPPDDHWWYRLAEVEKPQGYAFFNQPPAMLKCYYEDKSKPAYYIPNDGSRKGVPPAENIRNLPNGFTYYERQVPGKDSDWIKVFLLNEYGSLVTGKPVFPEYSDPVHFSREELKPYPGLPLLIGQDFGLCYDDQTEVLTGAGWKWFKDVDPLHDIVATRNPFNGVLEYCKPNFKVAREYEGEMLCWESTEVNFCVTPEHRVPFTFRDSPGKVGFVEARWLAEHSGGHHYLDLCSRWDPVYAREKRILGLTPDNYAELMGLYLSEGSSDRDRVSIAQSWKDPYMSRILHETGWNWRYAAGRGWRYSSRELTPYFKQFGGAWEKFVPDEIKQMPSDLILKFIWAFTRGDGHVRMRKNKAIEHTVFSVSRRLAGDLQELAQKVGWSSSLRFQKPRASVMPDGRIIPGKGIWVVTFKKRASRAELLKRNFKRKHYQGMIYCLNVPYHTLYVRRGGKPHWNGNTPTCVIGQETPRGQFRVLDELVSEGMGVERFARDLLTPKLHSQKYLGCIPYIIGDPAGSQRSQTNETTCFDILELQGFRVEPAPSNEFLMRRESVAWFLTKLTDGMPGLIISNTCHILRKAMMGGYKYRKMRVGGLSDKFAETPEKNEFSHVADALQYACSWLRSAGMERESALAPVLTSARRKVKIKSPLAYS